MGNLVWVQTSCPTHGPIDKPDAQYIHKCPGCNDWTTITYKRSTP